MWFYKKKGFTLLELMIVIVILGILATLAIPRFFDAIKSARNAEAKGTLGELYRVDQAYYTKNGTHLTDALVANGATIEIDLDEDGSADIGLIIPDSPNFTFAKSGTDVTATPKAGIAADTWTLDLTDGSIK